MGAAPLGHVSLILALEEKAMSPLATTSSSKGEAVGAPPPVMEALEDEARDVVQVEARLAPGTEGWRAFTLELRVREGFHLQATPPSSSNLVAAAIRPVLGRLRDVRFPEPEPWSVGGETLPVYRGHVRVQGAIETPAAGAPSVELTYQACDDRRCLPAVTRLVRFS
jgi:hypothetical protein